MIENADLLEILQKYAPTETKRLGLQTLSQIVGAINDKLAPHPSGAAPQPPDFDTWWNYAKETEATLTGHPRAWAQAGWIAAFHSMEPLPALAAPATGKLELTG